MGPEILSSRPLEHTMGPVASSGPTVSARKQLWGIASDP